MQIPKKKISFFVTKSPEAVCDKKVDVPKMDVALLFKVVQESC